MKRIYYILSLLLCISISSCNSNENSSSFTNNNSNATDNFISKHSSEESDDNSSVDNSSDSITYVSDIEILGTDGNVAYVFPDDVKEFLSKRIIDNCATDISAHDFVPKFSNEEEFNDGWGIYDAFVNWQSFMPVLRSDDNGNWFVNDIRYSDYSAVEKAYSDVFIKNDNISEYLNNTYTVENSTTYDTAFDPDSIKAVSIRITDDYSIEGDTCIAAVTIYEWSIKPAEEVFEDLPELLSGIGMQAADLCETSTKMKFVRQGNGTWKVVAEDGYLWEPDYSNVIPSDLFESSETDEATVFTSDELFEQDPEFTYVLPTEVSEFLRSHMLIEPETEIEMPQRLTYYSAAEQSETQEEYEAICDIIEMEKRRDRLAPQSGEIVQDGSLNTFYVDDFRYFDLDDLKEAVYDIVLESEEVDKLFALFPTINGKLCDAAFDMSSDVILGNYLTSSIVFGNDNTCSVESMVIQLTTDTYANDNCPLLLKNIHMTKYNYEYSKDFRDNDILHRQEDGTWRFKTLSKLYL